ncbi:MAG TPA: NAD(P)-binding domain-containing protein [Firmicutes bacterium]|nr:NAD(P)-binding domain-containing protein [Bacillota bacterium]
MTKDGRPNFAVLGAGHGGQAMAAHLAMMGFRVALFNRTYHRIEPIIVRGGIELDGIIQGFGSPAIVTSNIGEAIADADVLMVAVPACAHEHIAELCAPHLRDGQVILLNPGRTGGALEFSRVIYERGVDADVTIGEAQTFIYASRSMGPAQSKIFRIKNSVPIAALPASRTPLLMEAVREAFPQFVPAVNVLKTSLDNMGAVFHPAITLMNVGWIEARMGEFEFYLEGVTPSVAKVLEGVDAERVAVARAIGVEDVVTSLEWLEIAYAATGDNLYEAMHNNEGYGGIKAPATMRNRYLFEDIPASLVPIASLGKMLGVPTPTLDSLIHLGCLIHGIDYWTTGRTVKHLGLEGLTVKEIQQLVMKGRGGL